MCATRANAGFRQQPVQKQRPRTERTEARACPASWSWRLTDSTESYKYGRQADAKLCSAQRQMLHHKQCQELYLSCVEAAGACRAVWSKAKIKTMAKSPESRHTDFVWRCSLLCSSLHRRLPKRASAPAVETFARKTSELGP